MSADKLMYSIGNAASSTLSSGMTNTDTATPALASSTNFQAAPVPGEGMTLIDEGTSTEELGYATGISGGALTMPLANRGLEGGTAQAHSASASIKGVLTAGMWNNLITAMTNVLLKTTGAVDSTKVPVVSGGFSTTLTTTASTNVTLPTTGTLATLAGTETLSNKRRTRRVVTVTQSATPTVNTDNTDIAAITGLAQAITSMTTNLSGTPVAGDLLEFQITDNGTARGITWGASFQATTVALPSTTVISTMLRVLFEWNATASKWDCIATC